MKLWQWLTFWFAHEICRKQGWIDAGPIPAWVVALFIVGYVAKMFADIGGRTKERVEEKKTERTAS